MRNKVGAVISCIGLGYGFFSMLCAGAGNKEYYALKIAFAIALMVVGVLFMEEKKCE